MHVRWKTYQPGNSRETQMRGEIVRRIERWWEAFTAKAGEIAAFLRKERNWDLPTWMHEHLQGISPDLVWEYGLGYNGGHRLVITPETARHLRPLVGEILSRAPRLDGWSFHGHRLAQSIAMTETLIHARTGSPCLITGIRCDEGRHNLVDLTFEFAAKTLKRDKELARKQAFLAAEALLGEQILDVWIGSIEAEPGNRDTAPLSMLPRCFTTIRSRILDALPDKPLHDLPRDKRNWATYPLKPNVAEDYPARLDIFAGQSMLDGMWRAAHAGAAFYSERFSSRGERFCYVKIDGSAAAGSVSSAGKSAIEDALDEALRDRKLGCVVGGGTGLRYSYVDLALLDLPAAFSVLTERLRSLDVPRRSWLQFFDSEWAHEWVGVYEDTPPPPLAVPG